MTDWAKIQIEYEQGAKPKELAEKYNMTPKQISNRANRYGWVEKKVEISEKNVEKSRKRYDEEIDKLLSKSFVVLNEIINDDEAKYSDKINAVKCVIDISGLKKDNQELNVTNSSIEVKFI